MSSLEDELDLLGIPGILTELYLLGYSTDILPDGSLRFKKTHEPERQPEPGEREAMLTHLRNTMPQVVTYLNAVAQWEAAHTAFQATPDLAHQQDLARCAVIAGVPFIENDVNIAPRGWYDWAGLPIPDDWDYEIKPATPAPRPTFNF